MVQLAQQVASRLAGYGSATKDVGSVLEYIDIEPGLRASDPEINSSFCHELDRLVFCCTSCEYWFAQTENANPGHDHVRPWICRECARDG